MLWTFYLHWHKHLSYCILGYQSPEREGKISDFGLKVHQKFTNMVSNMHWCASIHFLLDIFKDLKRKTVFLTTRCFQWRTYAAGRKMDFRIRWTWIQILIQLCMTLDTQVLWGSIYPSVKWEQEHLILWKTAQIRNNTGKQPSTSQVLKDN